MTAERNKLLLPYEPRNAMLEGIEGRLLEGMRRHGLRRARYHGQQKTQQSLTYTPGKPLSGAYQFPPQSVSNNCACLRLILWRSLNHTATLLTIPQPFHHK